MEWLTKHVNGLHFNNLRGDIFGGLTAAVVALPLAMAMGVASGAGPIAGIYGAIFVGFFAALFGGTPAQVSGPTGPMTVVMAIIFTEYTGMFPDDLAQGAAMAFTVVIMGGLFQISFGLLKIGRFIELVPHPVVSGFMGGIGVIIILLQAGPLLGQPSPSKPLDALIAIPGFIDSPHTHALLLGLITISLVYLIPLYLPRLNRLFPAPLFALVTGTLVYLLFFTESGIPIIGDIPKGFPDFVAPTLTLAYLPSMIKSALILAALGTIDSLLTSLVADNVTRTQHKSDRELIGQGIGNTLAGFFGGLPGAGATMRTVVNVKAGGLTPISGALHAVILLVIVLGAGPLASYIPKAVLAGILIKVGTDIIDWDYLRHIKQAPKAGIIIMLVVLFLTVFVGLLEAVAIGMIIASFLFLKRSTELQVDSISTITDANTHSDVPLSKSESKIMSEANGQILLYHIGGALSFGAAKGMMRCLNDCASYELLIIDLSSVPQVDYSSSRALFDIIDTAQAEKRHVILVGVQKKVYPFMEKQGVLKLVGSHFVYSNREEALNDAAKKLGLKITI
ncbi:Sulfate permease [hydrothermal vent metagenome]|uniref:Sulfate permease n=1 Tax=hydrothermal vent metagenome TaxID=652676 RepID=A0A3B1A067_9ZZZZ